MHAKNLTRPCSGRSPARTAGRLLMSFCLPLCLMACAGPQLVPVVQPIDPPPPNLAAPCAEGPQIPEGDVLLGDAIKAWQEREAAAAECRDRHWRLVQAWPESGTPRRTFAERAPVDRR